MTSVVRGTSLRAGGACVRCRKGKTKCVYENGRAPCKNCAKGMHECYLPSESLAHHHGQSPARAPRPRESLPGDRGVPTASDRQPSAGQAAARATLSNNEKLTPELVAECERVINKTLPSCVAFHKPSFLQKLKSGNIEASICNGLLTAAARNSPALIRRYGNQGGPGAAAEHFGVKAAGLINGNLDHPCLADIQALCLLVIHEWGSRNAVRAYVYLGQAARMAQMFRIMVSHQNHTEADQFIRDESFRRTLWLIYILDCFLTSSPGRHPALSRHDVDDVALPCPDMSYNFGTPAYVRTLSGAAPSDLPDPSIPLSEVGEFGHIVMATKAWRDVAEMVITVTPETFSEQQCQALENEIENIRNSLPMHFMDKPGHINLHITMGSGYTYAMLHSLLHCATILLNRRRLLQVVTAENFDQESWRMISHTHLQTVERVFAACHGIVSLLLALEAQADKDSILCFPIVMLFACFTACSTVAWFSLRGLTPADVDETATAMVRDGMRFLQDGSDAFVLVVPWFRHLSVMAKVLRNSEKLSGKPQSVEPAPRPVQVKDDTASQPDTSSVTNQPEAMDYERQQSAHPAEQAEQPEQSEQPEQQSGEASPPRRPGFAAINGGSAGVSTPATAATASPPPAIPQPKPEASPDPSVSTGYQPEGANRGSDMTAPELCAAFERQLLELDDLAAFMGGGV